MVIAWTQQSIMGDEVFCPYGNYAFRWTSHAYSVTLPDASYVTQTNKEVINQLTGPGTQLESLQALNSRSAGDRNAFMYEWNVDYFIIAQANLLKATMDATSVAFSGDADTKKKTLKAWALWWKGYAYSRLGSMYLAGPINNAVDGTTSSDFVGHDALIAEANRNFDEAAALIATIPNNADYQDLMRKITPEPFQNGGATNNFKNGDISPDMWLRQINSYKARNFLVNKKVKDMTSADWTSLLALTANGLKETDNTFVYALDPTLTNDLNGQFLGNGSPYALFGDGNQFTFTSERLIQDFKTGDQRLDKGFTLLDSADWNVNIRGRGLEYGTRYNPISIEDGGLYATNDNRGIINIACTWDENALMTAEAKIRSGSDIEGGLALIDAVRASQGAGLAPVAGTSLTQAQAIEELRRERRVGLFLRGLAFFDARRWGVTAPVSDGGGRTNAMVLVPGSVYDPVNNSTSNPVPPKLMPCTIDYRLMDYFDVPNNELDFNAASAGSAPIKN